MDERTGLWISRKSSLQNQYIFSTLCALYVWRVVVRPLAHYAHPAGWFIGPSLFHICDIDPPLFNLSLIYPPFNLSTFSIFYIFLTLAKDVLDIYLLLSTYFKVINYYFDILQSFFNIVQTLLQLLPIFQRFSTACITRISCSFWKCFWELLLFIVSTVQGFVYKWQWILEDFNIYKLDVQVKILTMCGWCE